MNDDEEIGNEDVPESGHSLRGAIALLATLLGVYAAVRIVSSMLSFTAAIVAVGGVDHDASRTIYWVPQMLFFTFFFAATRRLRRFEELGRRAVISLSWLSLVLIALYTIAEFAFGPGRQNPPLAIAFKLRLLFTGGDVWDIVFPVMAILTLREPGARGLFEGR